MSLQFKFKVVLSPLNSGSPLDETVEVEASNCEVAGGVLTLKLNEETVAVFPAGGWKTARRMT